MAAECEEAGFRSQLWFLSGEWVSETAYAKKKCGHLFWFSTFLWALPCSSLDVFVMPPLSGLSWKFMVLPLPSVDKPPFPRPPSGLGSEAPGFSAKLSCGTLLHMSASGGAVPLRSQEGPLLPRSASRSILRQRELCGAHPPLGLGPELLALPFLRPRGISLIRGSKGRAQSEREKKRSIFLRGALFSLFSDILPFSTPLFFF